MTPDLPYVTTHATNNFGPSNFWVEGANVTIQGLRSGPECPRREQEHRSRRGRLHAALLQERASRMAVVGLPQRLAVRRILTGVSTVLSLPASIRTTSMTARRWRSAAAPALAARSAGAPSRTTTFDFNPLIGANWPGVSFNGAGRCALVHPPGGRRDRHRQQLLRQHDATCGRAARSRRAISTGRLLERQHLRQEGHGRTQSTFGPAGLELQHVYQRQDHWRARSSPRSAMQSRETPCWSAPARILSS